MITTPKLLSLGTIFTLSLLTAACGSDNGSASDPYAYPTGPDSKESGDGDNTAATAVPFAIGTTQERTLWPIGDEDYIAVDLTADTDYEFSADRLCPTCDTKINLYDTDGTSELGYNDDYTSGLASAIQYTPTVTGTYYVRVYPFNPKGVASYTLGARELVDADLDTFSSYHDCDDTDDTIYPDADEVTENGISENCSGTDYLNSTTADAAEPDDTVAQAKTMASTTGVIWEKRLRNKLIKANYRTLDSGSDVDYFKFTVPAHSAVNFDLVEGVTGLSATLYDSDGTTVLDTNDGKPRIKNTTDSSKTYYIAYEATTPTSYIPGVYSLGYDADGDGFYHQAWVDTRDCDDTDDTINPDATETDDDGIDSDCNGADNN